MKKKIKYIALILAVIVFAITVFVPKTFYGSSEIYTVEERKAVADVRAK